jgi:hypothetical protein
MDFLTEEHAAFCENWARIATDLSELDHVTGGGNLIQFRVELVTSLPS